MSLSLSNLPLNSISERLSLDKLKADVSSLQTKLSKVRPPQEFLDYRRLSKPANLGEIQSRVGYNLGYFQGNYIAMISVLSVYALVTNLLLMFVILLVGGGVFGISKLEGRDLNLPIGKFTTSQLYTGLLIVAVPLGFLASPISTMMWLIGSSAVSVLSHASFMEKPIETVFEEEV